MYGKTPYGDSVEDEWLIVYILRELSKVHTDIWVRICDTDGQFLLIEAANTLPKWLNPEVADFRVSMALPSFKAMDFLMQLRCGSTAVDF